MDEIRQRYEEKGQGHVFRFWDELRAEQQNALLEQLRSIDLDLLDRLVDDVLQGEPEAIDTSQLLPERVIELPDSDADAVRDRVATEEGERLLREGKVAVITVAGGQGTRLGFDGPKGCYPIGPVGDRTLFQIHAEKVLALRKRYGAPVPWYIMTSRQNDADTRAFLANNNNFGLPIEDVFMFVQRMLPAVDREGKLVLADKHRLFMSPDGHGGTIRALKVSGALDDMQNRGLETVFYFQVDNPLVRVADPVFLGHHRLNGSEMSSKVVRKNDPHEKVGVVCRVGSSDGPARVIEYSELPEELAQATDAKGELKYWAGSIAIHILDVDLLTRLTEGMGREGGETRLPFHRADKKIPYIDADGEEVKPDQPNGVKFETFIFDVLPMVSKTVTVECDRAEEFAPVKQATGVDSAESCRQALSDMYGRWLRAAGHDVPQNDDGSVNGAIEISPLVALDATDLKDKDVPPMNPGGELLLAPAGR